MSSDELKRHLANQPDDSRKHDALYEAHQRIQQLEKLNATLAAEIDRMRPVVDTAMKWNKTNYRDTQEINFALDALGQTCDDYDESQPILTTPP